MTTLLLVHGGLWEEGMGAERFWRQPGIVAGLEKRGFRGTASVIPSGGKAFGERFEDTIVRIQPTRIISFGIDSGETANARWVSPA